MFSEGAYMLGLAVAVPAAVLTGWLSGRPELARCVATVFAVWCLGVAFNLATGVSDAWQFNIVIDTYAAIVILFRPAGRWQAALGSFFCAQIAMHGGYGVGQLLGKTTDPVLYYDALTSVAWVQLLLIGGWCSGIWGGGLVRRWFGNRGAASAAPGVGRLAKSR